MNEVANDNELPDPPCSAEPDAFEPEPPKLPDNPTPLQLIAWLSATGAVTKDERDAADIVQRLAAFVYSRPACDGAAFIDLRDAAGKWSRPQLRGQEIKARLKYALCAPKTAARQRAVRLALVSRERNNSWNDTSALSCGLEDIANHFWPKPATATIIRNGVTLAKTAANDNEPQDATPERLAQAGPDHTLDAEGVRRIADSPFARMHARGQLDSDKEINEILFSAGRNYYQNWYYGGLGGISGIDYSRVGGGGDPAGPASGMPTSEFAAQHRHKFRKAQIALGERYRKVVDLVVLEERATGDIAEEISGYKQRDAGRAVVQERLNIALRRLAVFYGLATNKPARVAG